MALSARSTHNRPCFVAPHPRILLEQQESDARTASGPKSQQSTGQDGGNVSITRPVGFSDGAIFPKIAYPEGTSREVISRAGQYIRWKGKINMIVVLVGFQDEAGKQSKIKLGTADYMQNLLFSKGTRKPVGSLSDYYRDVSGGIITSMTGKIVGPYVLPQKMSYYANKDSGRGLNEPNSQTMANHTLDILIREGIDLTPFDHDQRAPGYVDALVIVHAGKAADEGGDDKESNIWSVKWNLPAERTASGGLIGTKVYSFLTIAENAELGVVAHEVGHLVFGWPDLYDTGNPTKKPGIGNWCLMANGSWLGDPKGTCPPHPSAWCKMQQGWVNVVTDKADSTVTIGNEAYVKDLKDPNRLPTIRKLWSNGYAWGDEYFLLEVRQKLGYDIFLPGEGLLVWHIDDKQGDNTSANERVPNYHVALMPAAGPLNDNGDATNPFPGTLKKIAFGGPQSNSYARQDTFISVTNIVRDEKTGKVKMDVKIMGPVKAKL